MKGKKLAESRLTWNYRIPWWPCGAWAARVGRWRGSRAAAAWCEPPGWSGRSPKGRRWRCGTGCPWGPGPAGPGRAAAASTRPTPPSRPPATAAPRPPPRRPAPTGRPPAASRERAPPLVWLGAVEEKQKRRADQRTLFVYVWIVIGSEVRVVCLILEDGRTRVRLAPFSSRLYLEVFVCFFSQSKIKKSITLWVFRPSVFEKALLASPPMVK